MVEQDIKNKVIELNGQDSFYDFKLHLPIPTIEFVLENAGFNMVEISGGELQAKNDIKFCTILASRIMYADKLRETKQILEYLIATNQNYRLDFLIYVATFINDMIMNGLINKLSEISNVESFAQNLSLSCYAMLKSGSLATSRFLPIKFDYRRGY